MQAQSNDSPFDKMLNQFRKLNYRKDSTLTEHQLRQTLNTMTTMNTPLDQFDPDLLSQLLTECQIQIDNSIKVRNFIATTLTAQNILKQSIINDNVELTTPGLKVERRRQLSQNILQHQNDLKMLSLPFNITFSPQSLTAHKKIENKPIKTNKDNSSQFDQILGGLMNISGVLKMVLIIDIILFVLELFVTFNKMNKTSLFNLSLYLAIFVLVSLRNFNKYYVGSILCCLALSIFLDLSRTKMTFFTFKLAMALTRIAAKAVMCFLFVQHRSTEKGEALKMGKTD